MAYPGQERPLAILELLKRPWSATRSLRHAQHQRDQIYAKLVWNESLEEYRRCGESKSAERLEQLHDPFQKSDADQLFPYFE
ncbi:hypothetical protein J1614_000585 [Plenodomus biglobosus]|nr:hypothetical protein J1614_000585 [Plenodomus biglobosus]